MFEEIVYYDRKLMKKGRLIAGLKEIIALFEETDGLWISLQGRDGKKRLEKQMQKKQKEITKQNK